MNRRVIYQGGGQLLLAVTVVGGLILSFGTRALAPMPHYFSNDTTIENWVLAAQKIPALAPIPIPSPAPASTPTSVSAAKYPSHMVMATVFYIGEGASQANAGISNATTEWDSNPVGRFGGIDNPRSRKADGTPLFKPKHNPYYVALPASEFSDTGPIAAARKSSLWAAEAKGLGEEKSLFKGRWVKVSKGSKVVYGQWLDTGPSDDPSATQDYGYVFGDSKVKPKNTFGLKAGIDLSPSMAFTLSLGSNLNEASGMVNWSFVDAASVPAGNWKNFAPVNNQTYW